MIIWRGAGIFAVIIFGLLYILGYGLDRHWPLPINGTWIYLGAALGGLLSWTLGRTLNAKVYAQRRLRPSEQIHTHSLFFIAMEWWAIPFFIGGLAFGIYDSNKEDERRQQSEQHEQKLETELDDKAAEIKSLIQDAQVGDYYLLRTNQEVPGKSYRNIRSLPLKVKAVDGTRVYCHFPRDQYFDDKLHISSAAEMLQIFGDDKETGTDLWIDKSILMKAVRNELYLQDAVGVPIPGFADGVPLLLTDMWRIDGPALSTASGRWTESSLSLTIENTGLPFTVLGLQYKGNIIRWKKYRPAAAVRQTGFDYAEDDIVRTEQKFILECDEVDEKEALIWLFCMDSEGQKYRYDITRDDTGHIAYERQRL